MNSTDVYKRQGQGLEVAMDRILAGGRAGREGAAVEGVLHRDDDEALGMAAVSYTHLVFFYRTNR